MRGVAPVTVRVAVLVAVLVVTLGAAQARAESTVLLAVEGDEDEQAALESDLESVGLEPVLTVVSPGIEPGELEATAESLGADGVLHLSRARDAVELFARRSGIWTSLETLPLAPSRRAALLRAVETLRAALVPPAAPPPAAPPPSSEPVPVQDPPRTSLDVLLTGDWSDPLGLGLRASLRVGHRLDRWLTLGFFAGAPLIPLSGVNTQEGSVSVYSVIAGVAAAVPLLPPRDPLQVDLFAALAAHTVIAAGRAQSPWTPQTSLGVALVPSGGVQLVWRVSRPVRVSLYAELGASVSPVAIAIAARDVGRYGEPFVGFGGGVGFEL